MRLKKQAIIILLGFGFFSCANTLTDQTGKKWDITEARSQYDMEKNKFHYGLGPDAIPPINNPNLIDKDNQSYPPADSSFEIFTLNYNEENRAYPKSELNNHEIVNDTIADCAIIVGYCPLFDLSVIWERTIDGKSLTFSASGWTYGESPRDSLFVLYDKETESMWYAFGDEGLQCVNGHYEGRLLPELKELSRSDWSSYVKDNNDVIYVTEN